MKSALSLLCLIATSTALSAADECSSPMQCYQLVYPSCRFDTNCGYGVYVSAEGLYWIANENGLFYAQTGVPGPGPQTDSVPPQSYNFRGNILRIKPDFDWGFRIGLGYNFCFDEWDTKASWTYFSTDKKSRFQSDGESFALNLWGRSDVDNANASSFISAEWNLCYNTFDLELARAFGAGKCFCLRPYFGIRAAWIDQSFTDFNQAELLNPSPGESLSTDLKALSNFNGAGFRFGLDGRFDFCWDISLFGLASYSLVYGEFNASFYESLSGDDGAGDIVNQLVIADTQDKFHMGTSSLQLALGLLWNKSYCRDRYRFGLNISWEQNLWFQINQMNHFQSELSRGHLTGENGNLSLQGISFGARFDF